MAKLCRSPAVLDKQVQNAGEVQEWKSRFECGSKNVLMGHNYSFAGASHKRWLSSPKVLNGKLNPVTQQILLGGNASY